MQFVVIYHLQTTPTNLLALVSVKLLEKKRAKNVNGPPWELNLGSQHKRRGPLHHVPQCTRVHMASGHHSHTFSSLSPN